QSQRPPGITNAPTTLLSMPPQPPRSTRPILPEDAAPSSQPPASTKSASSAPRSRWGVPLEPQVRTRPPEEAQQNREMAAARTEQVQVQEAPPLRPDAPTAKLDGEAVPPARERMPEPELVRPTKETSGMRPSVPPVKELGLTPPPAPSSPGATRFFWLQ